MTTDDLLGDPDVRAKLEAFVRRLVEKVPALRKEFEEHTEFFGGPISHLFFGDVVRWAQSEVERPERSVDLKALLDFLDGAYPDAGLPVQELIAFSFIENIDKDSPLHLMLGPNLKVLDDDFWGNGGSWTYS